MEVQFILKENLPLLCQKGHTVSTADIFVTDDAHKNDKLALNFAHFSCTFAAFIFFTDSDKQKVKRGGECCTLASVMLVRREPPCEF